MPRSELYGPYLGKEEKDFHKLYYKHIKALVDANDDMAIAMTRGNDHDILHDWFFFTRSGKGIRNYVESHGGITVKDVLAFCEKDPDTWGISFGEIIDFLYANGIYVIVETPYDA